MTLSTEQIDSELLTLSACEMARAIAAGNVSSRQLVEAHIRRIEAVNPALNAVCVPLFDSARRAAEVADEACRRGEPLGPLHGVPITVKECFYLAGTPSTEGIRRFAGEKLEQDGPLVRRLRAGGAIVLGKTNVPQLMLLPETDNPVYGRTNNPWNLARSAGGSSGGEAAIIAAGGSPLGLATDLGGSIRQPAHSCGICGIKPTSWRLTTAGFRDTLRGMEAAPTQPGPLARRVEDLYLALQVLGRLLPGEIDWRIAPVPMADPAAVRIERLRIGMFTDDGFFPASPAVVRAVREAASTLEKLGATVVEFTPPNMKELAELYFAMVSADGGADAARLLGSGPIDWRIRQLIVLGKTPNWLKALAAGTLRVFSQRRLASLLDAISSRSADGYWQLCQTRVTLAERFFQAWSDARLDAIVCPPHALPALVHGSTAHLAAAGSYGYWANLLGVPAGVLPVTRVQASEQNSRPASRDRVEQAARNTDLKSAELPVGVQVAGLPWREDVVLAIMGTLETEFQLRPDFPRTPIFPRE